MTTALPTRAPSRTWCRVLVIEHGSGVWGAQAYLVRLAPLLAERGVQQVLASPAPSPLADSWRALGLAHGPLTTPAERAGRTAAGRPAPRLLFKEAVRTLIGALRIARLARRVGADVIAPNSHWSHLEASLAGRLVRVPVVLHLHEESQPDALGSLRALSIRLATRAVAVSGAVAASVPQADPARIRVVRNGVDLDELRPAPARAGLRSELAADPAAPVVLVACRLDVAKGVDDVLRAVAELPAPWSHVQVAVAGESVLDPDHGQVLRTLGEQLLGQRVRFLGRREDIPDLMRASDVYVLASSLEGLPLGVLEAQAVGCPVVAYPTAGVPEAVEDGRTGLLVSSRSPEGLSLALTQLLSDPALARRLARDAREHVLQHHDLRRQADGLADVLRGVLDPGR